MSYCYGVNSLRTFVSWISPFHWQQQYDLERASDVAPATVESGPGIAISGTIDNPDTAGDSGTLDALYKVDDGAIVPPEAGTGYSVELRNGDQVLATQAFDVTFGTAENETVDSAPFAFSMAWVDGATSVVLLHGATVLDTQTVSSHAPTVEVTDPASHATWPAGTTQTISWTGSDVDGNALTYSLFYAPHGDDFEAVATDITDTSFQVDVDGLAGGSAAAFRVLASDGVNTGYADSATVSVPNKAPMVAITNPADGAFARGRRARCA